MYKKKIPLKAPKEMESRGRFFEQVKLGVPVYFPLELASGYALFCAHGFDDQVGTNFESTEEYIKLYKQVFKLIDYRPFESASDALYHMNAVSRSIVTDKMTSLLVENLGELDPKDVKYYISSSEFEMGFATGMPNSCSLKSFGVVRGLRMNICELLGLKPAELEKAQRDLALNFARQRLKRTYKENSVAAISSSSSSNDDTVVVPHRIEGVFVATRKNGDVICTRNLVPNQAVYGEDLISFKGENGIEIEYREWSPRHSNLAVAILSGVENIWVRPGSRVLCLNDVFGATLSHLSDLVGHNGLVYAVAESEVVLNMAEKRSNVIPIYCKLHQALMSYRMLLNMVDVICADAPETVELLHPYCLQYLKTGGHYLVLAKSNDMVNSSEDETMIQIVYDSKKHKEHKILELVRMEKRMKIEEKEEFMVVGGYRNDLKF